MPVDTPTKRKIVKQAYAKGADKAQVAQEHGITLNTLYGWKSELSTNGSRKATRPTNGRTNGHSNDFLVQLRTERERLQTRIAAIDTLLEQYEKH
jgi:transposase-like protein